MTVSVTATVLIPTHDHATLLPFAIRSVLAQTFADFELFVVGDGAGPGTRAVVEALAAADRRIRYFDCPKGERHGELSRHHALAQARGSIVAYCGDDDLWLQDHLANLVEGLRDADFVHTLHTVLKPTKEVAVLGADLTVAEYREAMLHSRTNYFGPTVVGHTMAAYRALPVGWSPAPPDLWTDLHMWRKFLAVDGLRFRLLRRVDTVHLASSERQGWTARQRLDELTEIVAGLAEPGGVDRFKARALAALIPDRAEHEPPAAGPAAAPAHRPRSRLARMARLLGLRANDD